MLIYLTRKVDYVAFAHRQIALLLGFVLAASACSFSQTQTTGRITGIVEDPLGAVIAGAKVTIEDLAKADNYSIATDNSGSYSLLEVPPGSYNVTIRAAGFTPAEFQDVVVGLAETVTLNATLQVAHGNVATTVTDAPPLVRSDCAELASTLDSRSLEALPLPTRNFLQLLTLVPGVSAPLTNNNAIGRNSPNVSVNGLRVTANSYQINGVDAGDTSLHVFADVAVPAPETISEVNVQTSLYDASVAGGGGSVQVVTRSGTNFLHGSAYEYFRNEVFNANDANLKDAGEGRPEMRRNVYGGTLGGSLHKDKAFFFISYQGSREANGATDQSLYKSVFIYPGLTNDRSPATLMSTFGVPSIDRISLQLLNFKLPGGQFLIPTPQTPEGFATGTALSTYHEEQFNTNLDYRPGSKDLMSIKFFYAHAPLFSALAGSNFGVPSSLPGFGTYIKVDNRVLSVQEIHTFSPTAVNEARFGYSFLRHDEVPQESLQDSSIGITRSTAAQYPGLPLILLARDQGGASMGTSDITYVGHIPTLSFAEIMSLQRGKHNIRFGGDLIHSAWHARAAIFSYGEIDFPTFQDFLIGNTGPSQYLDPPTFGFSHLGTGLTNRDFMTTHYQLFVQDDWKISRKLTINLGLRYELDPFPYDSQGRIGGFDPALYQPPTQVDGEFPVGPPTEGIIEAANGPPQFSLPGVTRVGKRLVRSIDPNNFGPRIGLAWSPLASGRLAVRGGYGIFYAPQSFIYLGLEYFAPPFFQDSDTSGQPFSSPFANAPPDSSFPLIQPGNSIAAEVIDRNARTPYVQQFNSSVQYEIKTNTTLQIAYAGARGVRLFRGVNINQARIASLDHPIVNPVTKEVITDNTFDNAPLRAPLQGVSTAAFALNQTTAGSTYHSLQTTLKRRLAHGLQFSAIYTFSRSIDNASNTGGGATTDGSLDRGGGLDTGNVWGNQLDPRANQGVSDFDRTHYFVFNGIWALPDFASSRSPVRRLVFSNWQLSGIVTAMSGLPADIFDPGGGSFYGLVGARPNWAPGANRATAMSHVPRGSYFNPSAFAEAVVPAGQAIPSAHDPGALAGEDGTDIGDVGRNVLRGPSQNDVDVSLTKRFSLTESRVLEFRADFFNLLNHADRDNPITDISNPGFGKVMSFSSSPRIVQFALKFTF